MIPGGLQLIDSGDLRVSLFYDFVRRSGYFFICLGLLLGKVGIFSVGSITTSILEITVLLVILCGFLNSPIDQTKRTLSLFFVFSFIVFLLSIFRNPVEPAMRDFSQVVFAGLVVFGSRLNGRRFIDSLALSVLVVTPYAVTYGISDDIYFFDPPLATAMLFNLRIPALFLVAVALDDILGGRRAYWHFPFLIAIFVLVFSIRTRGFHLALFVELLVFLLILVRSRSVVRPLAIVGVVLTIAVGIFLTFGFALLEERYQFISYIQAEGISALQRDPSLAARFVLWGIGLNEIGTNWLNHLVGMGFGRYLLLDPRGIGDYQYLPMWMIHNQVLSLYLTGGVVLMLVYAAFLHRLRRMAEHRMLNTMFLVGIIVYGMSTPILGKVVDASFIWIFLGLTLGRKNKNNGSSRDHRGATDLGNRHSLS